MIRPYYLLQLTIDGITVRFASNGEVIDNGKVYIDGLKIQSVSSEEARFSLPNHKKQGASIFLNHPVREADILIWLKTSDDDKTLVFKGQGDNLTQLTSREASIRAVAAFTLSKFPGKAIAPPDFNHITPAGTVIQFGGQTITIGDN